MATAGPLLFKQQLPLVEPTEAVLELPHRESTTIRLPLLDKVKALQELAE